MSTRFTISVLDINSKYNEEDEYDEENKGNLESPERIIKDFIDKEEISDISISNIKGNLKLYKFKYEVTEKKNMLTEMYLIKDLSQTYGLITESDAYLVFCNIEKSNTFSLLDKIINYIKNSCLEDTNTYIVGVYEDEENICKKNVYQNMKEYFKQKSFYCIYKQMKCQMDSDINPSSKKEESKLNNSSNSKHENIDNLKYLLRKIYYTQNQIIGNSSEKVKIDSGKNSRMDKSQCIVC